MMPESHPRAPVALTIAGSDSGGGAGIQADLKTFSAMGVYGCSVITALTAQNTRRVTEVHAPPAKFVRAQMDAVFEDITVDAVKIGMLGGPAVIRAVAAGLKAQGRLPPVVVDPVMVAKSGDRLLPDNAISALIKDILPLARVITPNLPEATALLGREGKAITNPDHMADTAKALLDLGPEAVLLKGGHLPGQDSSDLLLTEEGSTWLPGRRIETRNTHGTGCTLSSAVAAGLARGDSLETAVKSAKAYIANAIAAADRLGVGGGHGPVHHFHAYWAEAGG